MQVLLLLALVLLLSLLLRASLLLLLLFGWAWCCGCLLGCARACAVGKVLRVGVVVAADTTAAACAGEARVDAGGNRLVADASKRDGSDPLLIRPYRSSAP